MKIVCSQEEEPLGTAGPVRLARQLLLGEEGGMSKDPHAFFFIFNSDVVCEYPLAEMLECHKSHGREATMLTTQVEDPSKYGVVVPAPNVTAAHTTASSGSAFQEVESWGRVARFFEKPKEFVTNRVNAGIYILNKSVIDRIELKPHFLEKDIFPKLAENGQLYYCTLKGFWMDLG